MRRLLTTIAVLVLPAVAAGEAPQLGRRYKSGLYGFSLRPPADTERQRRPASRRLVSWVRRDEKTDAILWSLDVLRAQQKPTEQPLSEYAKALAQELSRSHQFKVDSTELGTVAGRPAMHFRGIWSGALRLWRRQAWVQLKPGHYLVLNIAGAEVAKAEMDAVLTAVLKTLQLFDPTKAREQRAESLKRGAAALAKLTPDRLGKLLSSETLYFLVKLKGKPVGFLRSKMSMASHEGTRGVWVVRLAALKVPSRPRQLVREELFASPDRRLERWRRITVSGQAQAALRTVQEAIKQDHLLLLHSRSGTRARKSRQFELPEPIRPAYLPDALGVLASRLIERSAGGSYGFAVFNIVTRGFDLRTIEVVGTETITHAGRKVKATHLTDQMADDAPQAELWVDQNGVLLTMQSVEGLTIERVDRAAVAAGFAAELVELEKLKAGPPAGRAGPPAGAARRPG